MKIIKLQKGYYTIVDDEDYEFLNQWKWYAMKSSNEFYATRMAPWENGKRNRVWMHRVILGITDENLFGDHKDHNGLNNQRNNLRVATRSQNGSNRVPLKNSTSKYIGVTWYSQTGKWKAGLTKNKKHKALGYFDNEIDAALAYNEGAKKHHGEFAHLNIL